MSKSILIVSLARCGSSAIYEWVKKNLSKDCIGFFEPTSDIFVTEVLPILEQNTDICTKVILRPYLAFKKKREDQFDQVVGLVRDPRDNLISRLLFRMVSPDFVANGKVYQDLLPLFEKKVAAPDSISVCELFKRMEQTGLMEPMIENRVQENLELFMDWHSNCKKCTIYKYEEFIKGHFEKISSILGTFPSSSNGDEVVNPSIKRSAKSGEWRQWFTPSDIDFFRPRFIKYMNNYGYDDDWNLEEKQSISYETSIEYIRKYAKL